MRPGQSWAKYLENCCKYSYGVHSPFQTAPGKTPGRQNMAEGCTILSCEPAAWRLDRPPSAYPAGGMDVMPWQNLLRRPLSDATSIQTKAHGETILAL